MSTIMIVPWQNDFISALGNWVIKEHELENTTIIFTHRRPRQYFKRYLAQHDALVRPCFMPEMTAVSEFIANARTQLGYPPLPEAKRLDQAELLYTIVQGLQHQQQGLLATLPQLDREFFLPWGLELASLMEELLRHDLEPADLTYMQGEVADYPAALLEQLSAIFHGYMAALNTKGWTTPGLDCQFAARHSQEIADTYQGKQLIAAGFYALSGSENHLFKTLWQRGNLAICWHTDPQLAEGKTGHWAAVEHKKWLKNWMTRAQLLEEPSSRPFIKNIRFREGFDRHSQLIALREELDTAGLHENRAVVLPDSGALMPVLHYLPDEDVNISMGYPLKRTSLARLIETILALQENRLQDGRYHWKDLVTLIRHPYIKMLGTTENKAYRRVLHLWEAAMRQGDPYIHPQQWTPPYNLGPLEQCKGEHCEPVRTEVLHTCLENFATATTLAKFAEALSQLVSMLHTHGAETWRNFLIDAECLHRLATSIIPQLKTPLIKDTPFSFSILASIVRRLVEQERVSFEPDPITGLQVLGVLETRLLHFKHVFLLDAVEDKLPGIRAMDPLLPDPMRGLLGLPDSRERDHVAAYNFYRLIMGAEQTVIFYQNGTQPGLLDGKSVRSRFVEQLLWEMEKTKGQLIHTGDPEIKAVNIKSSPVPHGNAAIRINDEIRLILQQHLTEKGLTPSSLDTYMQCPKRYYLGTLAKLRAPKEVMEDTDHAALGTLMHEVLKEFFSTHTNQRIIPAEMDSLLLCTLFETRLKESPLYQGLPYDGKTALLHSGRYRLERYLQNNQEPTVILNLEAELTATIDVEQGCIPLRGFADRIDQRGLYAHVLDYKTGSIRKPKDTFWSNSELWQRMHNNDPGDSTLLAELATTLNSIQLPAYLYLYEQKAHKGQAINAALINLQDTGKEYPLFPKRWSEEEMREVIEDQIPELLHFLARHIFTAPSFSPCAGRHCDWCDFKRLCGR